MTAFLIITGGLIFTVLVVCLGLYDDKSKTQDELEKDYQRVYGPILDAIDPQRIEDRKKEKLMNDYEYYLLTGELPPTK